MSHSDRLFMDCHRAGCDFVIEKWVACDAQLTPSELIEWHERMIRHIRKEHSRAKA